MSRTICTILTLLAFSISTFAKEPEIITQNSYFEDGLENWEVILDGGAEMEAKIDDSDSVKGSQCVYLDIKKLGGSAGFWEIKLGQIVLDVIEQGEMYTLSVWAKGEEFRQIKPHMRTGIGGKTPWLSQHGHVHDITDEWAEYSHTFTAGGEPDGIVDIALGTTLGNLWLDNIRFYKGPYEEDPDLGRTKKMAVDSQGKLVVTWGRLRSMN